MLLRILGPRHGGGPWRISSNRPELPVATNFATERERERDRLADWLAGRQRASELTPFLLPSLLPPSLPLVAGHVSTAMSEPAIAAEERERRGREWKNRRGRRAQESVGPAKEAGQGRRKMVACPLALGPLDSRRETMGGNAWGTARELQGSAGERGARGGNGRNGQKWGERWGRERRGGWGAAPLCLNSS